MIYCNFARFELMKIQRQHISSVIFCLYILAVGVMCFSKPENIPHVTFDWFGLPADKVVHCLMFIPFPVLAYMSFVPERFSLPAKAACIVAAAIIGAGISYATEVIQSALGYRSFEIKDLIADLAGICSGTSVLLVSLALKTKKK